MTMSGHENVITCILFLNKDKSKRIVLQSYYFNKSKKRSKQPIEETKEEKLNLAIDFILSGSRDKEIKLWNC